MLSKIENSFDSNISANLRKNVCCELETEGLVEVHVDLYSAVKLVNKHQFTKQIQSFFCPEISENFENQNSWGNRNFVRCSYMIKYITEYVSCEYQTWGLFRQSVGLCDDIKPAKKESFTHTNY